VEYVEQYSVYSTAFGASAQLWEAVKASMFAYSGGVHSRVLDKIWTCAFSATKTCILHGDNLVASR
jgi:hypothetical protein